jgi:hypothetical protein
MADKSVKAIRDLALASRRDDASDASTRRRLP